MGLADIPGYGAYVARRQQIEQEPLAQLQQAQGVMSLRAAMDKQREEASLKTAMAESGGDAEKAVAIAVKSGNWAAAHQLAPLAKLQQEQRQNAETPQLLADLNRQFAAPVAAPAAPVAVDIPTASPADAMVTPKGPAESPQEALQRRIAHAEAMSMVPKYANNPHATAMLRAQIDKLNAEANKAPTKRDRIEGENVVQEEFANGKWNEIGRGPRFAKQVEVKSGGDAKLTPDDTAFMAGQYLAGDRTVMQNLGRGTQGAENIVALRREIAKQARENGATPRDVAAAIGEFEGFKSGQRALGTREAQIEMAANVTKQFAPLAVEASDKFDRTGIKSLNDVEKAVLSRTASPELRRFNFANTSLINAYARAVNPSGVPTVSDKDHAREILDTGFSKGDYAAAVDQLGKEIDAELKAPGAVKRGMRGFLTGREAPAAPGAAAPASPSVESLLEKYKN